MLVKHPDAIKEITESYIQIETGRGVFELPLVDTELPAECKAYKIPEWFIDQIESGGLRESCKYYQSDEIKKYYKDKKQELADDFDLNSIALLMPSGDSYIYNVFGKPMRELMNLIGMTDEDLVSIESYSGKYKCDDGCVWIGFDYRSRYIKCYFGSDMAKSTYTGAPSFPRRCRFIKKISL